MPPVVRSQRKGCCLFQVFAGEKMKKTEIKGVVFDMDGLMFDSERVVQLSWDQAGELMGLGKLGHNIYHTLGFNREKRKEYFKEKYGEEFPFEKFQELYRQCFQEYVRENGLPVKQGLHEILEFLKESQIPMAVATSSSQEHALGNLEKEGILGYFQAVITGNMVSRGKPWPEIYEKACRALDLPPEQVLALEDSYSGLRAAHTAGMITVMVPDLLTDSSCVDEILDGKMTSLLEVRDWIASMR